MQVNLCGLIQMLLPLRYQLNYRPEDNLMDAWGPIKYPQYYVWDHVALALHMKSGEVRSLRSSRRALLQIQLHRRVHYPLCLSQVLKFDSDRLRQNLKFCERDDVTIAPKFYFDDSEEAQSVIESLWPESSLEKDFAGNKSIKLSVTNLKVMTETQLHIFFITSGSLFISAGTFYHWSLWGLNQPLVVARGTAVFAPGALASSFLHLSSSSASLLLTGLSL